MLRKFTILPIVCLAFGASLSRADEGSDFFEKKVRPVLVDQCYKCHSEAALKIGKLKGHLLLDTREGVLKGGESGPVIVPGKPDESRLIKAVRYADADNQMPPKEKLPDNVVADLEKWVSLGAPDPREGTATTIATKKKIDVQAAKSFWSFKPLASPQVPAVPNGVLARTPIDAFILAPLLAKGITPNPPASRAVLVRRAYADLLGLPPTPAQVDAFVNDPSPDAWDKLIDTLLATPQYGERWGRHWLDIVRFAESNGYEFDGDRPGAFQYRDFVIRALNADMPFDQFVRLQIAGDKINPGDFEATAATGFIVAGPSPGQTTAKTIEPLRYDQLDDMIATLGSSMLGMTIGCARCHDHKFDPIPQEDYYRLASCFAQTDANDARLDPHPEVYREAKTKWDAERATLTAAWEKYTREQATIRIEHWKRDSAWQAIAAGWFGLQPTKAVIEPSTPLQVLDDGSVLAPAKDDRNQTFILTAQTRQKKITGIRVDALTDPSLPASGPGRGKEGEFTLTRLQLRAQPLEGKEAAVNLKLKAVKATSAAKDHPLEAVVDDKQNIGWTPEEKNRDQSAWFEVDGNVGFDSGTLLTITLRFENASTMGRCRISITTADRPVNSDGNWALQTPRELSTLLASGIDDHNRGEIARWFSLIDVPTHDAYAPLAAHLAKEPQPPLESVFSATNNKPGQLVYHLTRGETNKKNAAAIPGFVQVVTNSPNRELAWTGNPANKATPLPDPRVALANWITDSKSGAGHLLARVMVNRLWLHHLGRGIVTTPNDFGTQGDAPSHPELLDWLAQRLVEEQWKLKPLHKLIMTSAVYMQSSQENPSAMAVEPQNKLWWRRSPTRLDAEAIRDSILAVSGTLKLDLFGPGTLDESSLRRSIYFSVKRTRPIPFMQLFDAPETLQSIGARQVTTVATQALTLMNSPIVRQRAEQLARRVHAAPGDDLAGSIDQAFRLAFNRHATDAEKNKMVQFITRQAKTYGTDAAATDKAVADFCQVLFCSNEFIYVD